MKDWSFAKFWIHVLLTFFKSFHVSTFLPENPRHEKCLFSIITVLQLSKILNNGFAKRLLDFLDGKTLEKEHDKMEYVKVIYICKRISLTEIKGVYSDAYLRKPIKSFLIINLEAWNMFREHNRV